MIYIRVSQGAYARFVAIFIAFSLLTSFGLHSIQIEHEHPTSHHSHNNEHSSKGIMLGEYMHLADKKLVALVLMAGIVLFAFLDGVVRMRKGFLVYALQKYLQLRKKSSEQYHFFNYLCLYFKKGIIHTKAY